jgi:hypothetical protein
MGRFVKPAVVLAAMTVALPLFAQPQLPAAQQDRRARVDVQHYVVDAEINPDNQTIAANVQVRFVPQDATSSVSFELNNALNVSRIVDGAGRQIPASRSQQDFRVTLNFPEALQKGQPAQVTFTYDGKLTGQEESPVYGIKFASIQKDHAFLMYPARWFPVNDYTIDRYTAEFRITAPAGYRVLTGNDSSPKTADGRQVFTSSFTQPSFPGSIAVVQGEPVQVSAQGASTRLYLRDTKDMAQAYGEETGKVLAYLTSVFGLPPQSSLTIVETEAGTPNGYSSQGLLFLSPRAIGKQVNPRLLANQIARQWLGVLVSPDVSKSHVARQRRRPVCRTALPRASERRWRSGERSPRHLYRSAHARERSRDPVGSPGRLFAGILGRHRRKGSWRDAHAPRRC